jgi:1-acyl-sn-glycerol-3-phosphate acyltransferase
MPPKAPEQSTPLLVRAYRLIRLSLHFVLGCAVAGAVFPFVDGPRELRIIKRWSRGVLAILGVRLRVHGRPPGGHQPTVIVCNHVSWLDIWVIHAVSPVRFVAKSDVRRWPLIGWLVARSGTIFIERSKRSDTARTNRTIVDTLAKGERVGIFPEGTTTDGTHLHAFHASLFQPALGAGARVVTAAIRYQRPDGSVNLDASYAGDRSLIESLRLILRQRSLRAELIFAGEMEISGKTRREIAHGCEALIAHALHLPVPGRKSGTASDPPAAGHSDAGPTDSRYPERTDSAP